MCAISKLLLAGSWLGSALAAPVASSNTGPPTSTPSFTNASSPGVMTQLNPDPEFSFVLGQYLAQSESGGANTGEVLRAASQIKPTDFESFYSEFKFLADQIMAMSQNFDVKKHPISVRNDLFRAATYYRAADFFLHGNQSDPRIYSLWDAQLAAFNQAASMLKVPAENVNVSTNHGFYIPVRIFRPAATNERRPTIVIGNGYDGSQEDSYHAICPQALARGWNCVTYEGPGQPVVRRQQKRGFIADWWNVVTPLTDYLLSRPDVDKDKMALLGISYGAQITPLAASREHRYAAVLAVDGLYDLGSKVESELPPSIREQFSSGNRSEFDASMNAIRVNPQRQTSLRFAIDQGLFAWNTNSPFEWLTQFKAATLAGHTDTITTPMLATQGQDDDTVGNQTQIFLEAVGNRSDYHLFKTDVGAGEHCQTGAEAQLARVIFDWMEDKFTQK